MSPSSRRSTLCTLRSHVGNLFLRVSLALSIQSNSSSLLGAPLRFLVPTVSPLVSPLDCSVRPWTFFCRVSKTFTAQCALYILDSPQSLPFPSNCALRDFGEFGVSSLHCEVRPDKFRRVLCLSSSLLILQPLSWLWLWCALFLRWRVVVVSFRIKTLAPDLRHKRGLLLEELPAQRRLTVCCCFCAGKRMSSQQVTAQWRSAKLKR